MWWKCLACGRNKFIRPGYPHRCNGQYRKHKFLKGWEISDYKGIKM